MPSNNDYVVTPSPSHTAGGCSSDLAWIIFLGLMVLLIILTLAVL